MDQIGPEGHLQLSSQQNASDIRAAAIGIEALELRLTVVESKLAALAFAIERIGEASKVLLEQFVEFTKRFPDA